MEILLETFKAIGEYYEGQLSGCGGTITDEDSKYLLDLLDKNKEG